MDSVSSHRWSLSFVAFHWRHLLWSLPLAGLLAAAALEWRKYERSLQPSGEIEVAGPARLGPHPLFAGHFPTYDFATIQRIALSDEVLAAACDHAELTRAGTPLDQCITELRDKIELTAIPGSSSVLVSIRGRPSPQARLTAEAVVRKTAWYADKTEYTERKRLMGKEESDLASLRRSTGDPLSSDLGRTLANFRSEVDRRGFSTLPADLPASEQEYLSRKTELYVATRFHQKDKGPLLVKRWPWMLPPVPTTRQRVQEALPAIMTGIGGGILAAVGLAYLLEALFPKKAVAP